MEISDANTVRRGLHQGKGGREMSELLPPELWTKISLQLPVRSLITLKCVSKSFLSVIQNPNFAYLHFSTLNNRNSGPKESDLLLLEYRSDLELRVCRGDTRIKILEAQIKKDQIDDIVGYVDGMIWVFRFCNLMKNSILCNSSIRKSLLIPPCPATKEIGPLAAGLGYDPVTNDYKAVALKFPTPTRPGIIRIHVYSLRIGSWRSSQPDSIPFCLDFKRNVYANGAIHWMARDVNRHPYCLEDQEDYSHIVSFDLGTEGFRFRVLPGFFEKTMKVPMSFHGSLAVLYMSETHIRVWVLAEVGWAKECEIQSSGDFYRYLREVGQHSRFNSVVFSEKNDELLLATHEDGLISYNFKTQQWESSQKGVRRAEMYVESLLWRELLPSGE